jgi:hypothetical protein
MATIFLACDGKYYNKWAVNCIHSIQLLCPWVNITTLIINPDDCEEISGVEYFYETRTFDSTDSEIAYYQAARFLKCYEIFGDAKDILIIDVDTILVKPFTEKEFLSLVRDVAVLRHPKSNKLLAGMVTLGHKSNFRKNLKIYLEQLPISKWYPGWDQNVLNQMDNDFKLKEIPNYWMHLGKHRDETIFLTLKGDKKDESRFLEIYNKSFAKLKEEYGNT